MSDEEEPEEISDEEDAIAPPLDEDEVDDEEGQGVNDGGSADDADAAPSKASAPAATAKKVNSVVVPKEAELKVGEGDDD